MLEVTRKQTTEGSVDICLRVPAEEAARFLEASVAFWRLAGHDVREVNEDGEQLFSVEEVLGESTPGRLLRGARFREELTQQELADRLGIARRHISEMENNKRPIGKAMAKRLGDVLNVGYKIFL
ncbi:helix-turn-helix transcriptional regulator [Maridesulfovibrio sp. FT414]|uniref:helix-turn-helix transcriptional regulator n=1 Tax=Maridesulfovibrio sp. FT414 TaxID=2979469 RepID=UPI003D80312A